MKKLPDIIKINIEASDKECAFFALYAGLRMYFEYKKETNNDPNSISIAGAEAYCMLQDMKERYPIQYNEAKDEYDEFITTKNLFSYDLQTSILNLNNDERT